MTDDDLTKLVDKIASASGYGGLDSSTMYGEFALDVAKAVREECAKLVDIGPDTQAWEIHGGQETMDVLRDVAARIRGA